VPFADTSGLASGRPGFLARILLTGAVALLLCSQAVWSFPLFTNSPSYNSDYGAGSSIRLNVCGFVIGANCDSRQSIAPSGGDAHVTDANSAVLHYGSASATGSTRANAAGGTLGV